VTDLALSLTPPPGPGWVQLPVEHPKRSGIAAKLLGAGSGKDKALADWAQKQARVALGPDPVAEDAAAYTQTLTSLTLSGRGRGEKIAYVWFPEPGAAPIAQLSVSEYGRSGGQANLTLNMLEEELAWRDEQTVALETVETNLPGGPAVRVRREQAIGDQAAGDGPADAIVSVTYAFRPPQIKSALVLTMFWSRSDDEPLFTEIADTLANTLRVAGA
jgi:hypothetical protein